MSQSPEFFHILALGSIPPSSIDVLSELLGYCGACSDDKESLIVDRQESILFVLFRHREDPVVCGLELCEILEEVPSLAVRMAIHSGTVRLEESPIGEKRPVGDGIEEVRTLLKACEAGEMRLSDAYSKSLQSADGLPADKVVRSADGVTPPKLVILDADGVGLSDDGLETLEEGLSADGYETEIDSELSNGVAWAKSVESRIRSADIVIAFYSESAANNEVLELQLEIAIDERRKRGRPQILPVWRKDRPALASLNQNRYFALLDDSKDPNRLLTEVRAVLALGQTETDAANLDLADASADDRYYVNRVSDAEIGAALDRHESIVLVKGPRQVGKTLLAGRAKRYVESRGWRCATTDFQKLSSRQFESESACYRAVATTLARQLDFEFDFDEDWLESLGPNRNIDDFVRDMVAASDVPLVWIIDEADRLFGSPIASEFFGLVRSWHNARATDPYGPWERFTVVIVYATDAHLFIRDFNRSPFNVGYPVEVAMFSRENTADLNERFGRPISDNRDFFALHDLLGGQPYLTRRAMEILTKGEMSVPDLLASVDRDDGPFRDHLRRILVSVTQLPIVWNALVRSLTSPDIPESEGIQRLIASGILVRRSGGGFELRSELYRRYLARFVTGGFNV